MANIIIDTREKKIIDELSKKEEDKPPFTIQQLDIGDIWIKNELCCIVIERKTITDMYSSVKDGRYKEQKARLLTSPNSLYIIENDTLFTKDKVLSGVYLNTMLRDRIPICFTNGVCETVKLILHIFQKLIDKPDRFVRQQFKEYIDCIQPKTQKINNITPSVCFVNQLSQIPRISTKTAKKIAEHHTSMKDLIDTLNNWDDPQKYLESFEGIGPGTAKTIIEYLGMKDEKDERVYKEDQVEQNVSVSAVANKDGSGC